MIEIEHLTKKYGEHLAVDDLNFQVESGQIYGFLGPNGAGKSTTMNIMAGCLSATEGTVRIDGYDIFEAPDKAKRRIGYLPEQPPLYLGETPLEYLTFVGEAKGLRGDALKRQITDVTAQSGIVVDNDREHYAFQRPYVLMPDLQSDTITAPLIQENSYAILPICTGLTVGYSGKGTATELLTTSESSFSKLAGYDLATYEKEEGDVDGPFTVGVSIETYGGGGIVWFSSSQFLEDQYNAWSSGANGDLAMNALSSLVGETEAVAIRSKSLNYNYLTISDSTSSLLKLLMVGVFPLAYLGIGIAVVTRRRRLQNAPV